jgi:hypothetical protein
MTRRAKAIGRAALMATATLCLSACSGAAPIRPPAAVTGDITGTRWVLRRFRGERVLPSRPEAVTLQFARGQHLFGTTTCNSVGGNEIIWSAAPGGDRGTFRRNAFAAATIMTTAGCSNAAGSALGDKFWRLMVKNARSWSTDREGLRITFDDHTDALLTPIKPR